MLGWALLATLGVGIALMAWDIWVGWIPYVRAKNVQARGQKEEVQKWLGRVIAAPTFSRALKRDARYRLAWLHMERGEYDTAIELLQTILQQRLAPTAEARTRQRLAEALTGAGRNEEAQSERERSTALLGGAKESYERAMLEADAFRRRQQYEDAYSAYERGLSQTPESQIEVRARIMGLLGLMAFNAGRSEDTIRWCEASLALKPDSMLQMIVHGTAALGYGNVGRFEEAERHIVQKIEIATKLGNQDEIMKGETQLAGHLKKCGKLAEAMWQCEQAKEKTIANRRYVYAVEMECLKAWGRFPEAMRTLEMMQKSKAYATPSEEQRSQMTMLSEVAVLQAELGKPMEALKANRQALAGLQNDVKLTTQYRANGVWMLALAGRGEEARQEAAQVEPLLVQFPHARSVQLSALGMLGRAFVVLGDYSRAEQIWNRFLDWHPDPVSLPHAYFFLGECRTGMGDEAGAADFYRRVVETGLDTCYVTYAQRRLDALPEETPARVLS